MEDPLEDSKEKINPFEQAIQSQNPPPSMTFAPKATAEVITPAVAEDQSIGSEKDSPSVVG